MSEQGWELVKFLKNNRTVKTPMRGLDQNTPIVCPYWHHSLEGKILIWF
jgi:hypothetical protein